VEDATLDNDPQFEDNLIDRVRLYSPKRTSHPSVPDLNASDEHHLDVTDDHPNHWSGPPPPNAPPRRSAAHESPTRPPPTSQPKPTHANG